ncbi:MAG: acetolactate synthase small subunit [Firmicutes bacterium]|nr:acetolactate synthase small subunit [Bacillota bacterium]MBQ3198802.1 acetolactate synthase small subunit [Bacillota bacterium]
MKRKQLAVLVEDSPGVLTHVSGLISRRGYNIESIAASKTEKEGITRISLVVSIEEDWQLEQIMAQIEKLVQVYRVVHLSKSASMSRELALVKIKTSDEYRQEIMSIVDVFMGRIIDFNAEAMVIEVTNDSKKIDSFCMLMKKYGIIEIIRTGEISLSVLPVSFIGDL